MNNARKPSVRQELPATCVLEERPQERFGSVVVAHGYDVCSWRPGDPNSGDPCTEVHLLLPVVDGIRVALRLKSQRALDELVGVLLAHRKDVFG